MASISAAASARVASLKPSAWACQVNNLPKVNFVSAGPLKSTFPSLRSSRFRVCCAAKPETVTKVCEIVKTQLALGADKEVSSESKFSDLGADSLDTVEIVMKLEEEFGISVEEDNAQSIATVQDAADLIEKLVDAKVGAA